MSTHSVVVGTLAAVAILNFAVSILIVVSRASARRQKMIQLALIWFFPLIGAIGLGLFISVQGNMRPRRTNTIGAVDLDDHAAQLPNATQSHI